MSRFVLIVVLAILALPSIATAQVKRALDHDAYDIWLGIEDQAISDDGRWLLYRLAPQDGDAELRVQSLTSNVVYSIPRGDSPRFTADGRFVVTIIKPELQLSRQAQREKKPSREQPKDSLGVLNLSSGDVFRVERVESYRLPGDGSRWVAYLLDETAVRGDTAEVGEEAGEAGEDEDRKDKDAGTTLVVRDLNSGTEASSRAPPNLFRLSKS